MLLERANPGRTDVGDVALVSENLMLYLTNQIFCIFLYYMKMAKPVETYLTFK